MRVRPRGITTTGHAARRIVAQTIERHLPDIAVRAGSEVGSGDLFARLRDRNAAIVRRRRGALLDSAWRERSLRQLQRPGLRGHRSCGPASAAMRPLSRGAVLELNGDRYTIEMAPLPDADEASRGVVGRGAVGSRYVGWLRLFRLCDPLPGAGSRPRVTIAPARRVGARGGGDGDRSGLLRSPRRHGAPARCRGRATRASRTAGDELTATAPPGQAPLVLAGAEEVAQTAAELIANRLRARPLLRMLLPTGRTPLGVYAALRAHAVRGELPSEAATVFQLDEYLGLGRDERSFGAYLDRELARHPGRGVPPPRRRGAPTRRPSATATSGGSTRRRSTSPSSVSATTATSRSTSRDRAWRVARASSPCTRGRGRTRRRTSAASSTSPPTRSRSACARCSPRASC